MKAIVMKREPVAPDAGLSLLPVERRHPRDAQEAHLDVQKLRRNGRICAYLLGDRLAWIRDNRAFAELGFRHMKAYLASLTGTSMRTLYRCLALADAVPAEVVEEYDVEKIDAGIALLPPGEGGAVLVSRKALEALRVPAREGGRGAEVSFRKASVEELEAEVQRRREASLNRSSAKLKHAVARLQTRLGSGVTAIGSVRIQRQGSRHVAVIAVAADRIEEFERLLR
jgi:hypothetical protein